MAIFSELDDGQVRAMTQVCTERGFKKGETIVEEGGVGDEMYILAEGQVTISKSLVLRTDQGEYQDKDRTFIILDAQSSPFFGEMGVLERNVRTAKVACLTDCRLVVLTREAFQQYCQQDPVAGVRILTSLAAMLCNRLRTTNKDVLKLTTALSIALSTD